MSKEPSGPWVAPMEQVGATDPRNGRPSWNRLAELADVSTTTVTQMVSGKRSTSPATVKKIAAALRVEPEDVSSWLNLRKPVRTTWQPPPEADLLTDRQRDAVAELIRAFTSAEQGGVEEHADSSAANKAPSPADQLGTQDDYTLAAHEEERAIEREQEQSETT